ncbi:MAG: hypothetical protein ICV76_06185 [Nitrospiraceae bacterium]|nr:hypothetical protein [Nitrospiraceae bacterium]
MIHRGLRVLPILLSVLIGCSGGEETSPPSVKFLEPEHDQYDAKIDFARLEHEFPLRPADLMTITPKNLEALTQEQVDQIYARLAAGPIPDGSYDGRMFFPKGASGQARTAEIVGGFKGKVVNFTKAKLDQIGEAVWKGKVFYRDQRILRNRIDDLLVLKPLLGDDIGKIQKQETDGKDAWLLFPAKLYCGQSLLDGRRESIIIDYAFSDDVPGYRPMPDVLAGRDGLKIRDEIRMIRPGFYLGRAYMNRAFVLNFTLYNPTVAEKEKAAFQQAGTVHEDCEIGSQRMTAMAK